jgi:hypothetical protein
MKIVELCESIVNIWDDDEKRRIADEVWNILVSSYANIGGFRSASSPKELIDKSGLWKIVTRHGNITAVSIYKNRLGRKNIALGSDGTMKGKLDLKMIMKDDIKLHRIWAEVSGAPEHIMKRLGAIPNKAKYAAALTKKHILSYNEDNYHYTRLIMGNPHEKIIYGVINPTSDEIEALKREGIDLQTL